MSPGNFPKAHEAVIPFFWMFLMGGNVVRTGDFLNIRSQGLQSPVLVFEFSRPPGYARGGNAMDISSM